MIFIKYKNTLKNIFFKVIVWNERHSFEKLTQSKKFLNIIDELPPW